MSALYQVSGMQNSAAGASEDGHLEVVRLLLADANTGPAEWNGRTALEAASEGGHRRRPFEDGLTATRTKRRRQCRTS
jgi:hypothetical protein